MLPGGDQVESRAEIQTIPTPNKHSKTDAAKPHALPLPLANILLTAQNARKATKRVEHPELSSASPSGVDTWLSGVEVSSSGIARAINGFVTFDSWLLWFRSSFHSQVSKALRQVITSRFFCTTQVPRCHPRHESLQPQRELVTRYRNVR